MSKRVKCPRCGYERAKANARGPNHVWCKCCGGLVPIDYRDTDGPQYDDPVMNAIATDVPNKWRRRKWHG